MWFYLQSTSTCLGINGLVVVGGGGIFFYNLGAFWVHGMRIRIVRMFEFRPAYVQQFEVDIAFGFRP
jgi:hypothetical protein